MIRRNWSVSSKQDDAVARFLDQATEEYVRGIAEVGVQFDRWSDAVWDDAVAVQAELESGYPLITLPAAVQ